MSNLITTVDRPHYTGRIMVRHSDGWMCHHARVAKRDAQGVEHYSTPCGIHQFRIVEYRRNVQSLECPRCLAFNGPGPPWEDANEARSDHHLVLSES